MSTDARFWRNVTLIALAHIALLIGLIRWSYESKNSNAQSIVWISGSVGDSAAGEAKSGAAPQPTKVSTPSPEPKPLKPDETEEERPVLTAAKSEIQLPTPTATSQPKPTATPKATSKPTSKPTPKATPKPTPKKTVLAKASPKPTPKVKPTPEDSDKKKEETEANIEKKKIAKAALAKTDDNDLPVKKASASKAGSGKADSAGTGGHAGSASEFGWYGNMLHDRFYSEWVQPTTNVTSGAKISTLVKIRIEKDGHVSNFEIIKPSENVVVDESVATIAKRVTQVDPLPAGLGNGDHYDVKINFELNSEQ
jgi:TonB family protein